MSIATEITRLQTAKADIKTVLESKGMVVGDGLIDTYAEIVDDMHAVSYNEGLEQGITGGYADGYEVGYEKGKAEGGGDSWYDTFWDSYQDNGMRTNYAYAFRGSYWNDVTFVPKYRAKVSHGGYMFFDNEMVDGSKIEYFDFSSCTNVASLFGGADFETLPTLNFTNVTSASSIFQACKATTIEKIIINTDGSFPFVTNVFNSASLLKEIRFEGVIGKSIDLQWQNHLSKDSITNIFEVLSSTTEGLSASFSKKAVKTAFETGEGLADGTSSSEWAELIATKPNWTITLV